MCLSSLFIVHLLQFMGLDLRWSSSMFSLVFQLSLQLPPFPPPLNHCSLLCLILLSINFKPCVYNMNLKVKEHEFWLWGFSVLRVRRSSRELKATWRDSLGKAGPCLAVGRSSLTWPGPSTRRGSCTLSSRSPPASSTTGPRRRWQGFVALILVLLKGSVYHS